MTVHLEVIIGIFFGLSASGNVLTEYRRISRARRDEDTKTKKLFQMQGLFL